tara:strand:- start:15644 stop:17824 length:2181 start_codon:yes stop_codon:yes gene_type:complete
MTDPVNAILEQFQLSRAATLPELLLRGLEIEEELKQQDDAQAAQRLLDLLKHSPLLLLQSLKDSNAETVLRLDPQILLQGSGKEKVFTRLRQAVEDYNPASIHKKREVFLLMHWRQSLLCSKYISALASHCKLPHSADLESSGALLNLGELILEHVKQDDYLRLHAKTSSEAELCRLEDQHYGCNHAMLGASLLAQLGVESFYCDAVRYHHRSFEDIADASVEVKLCWFANQLASKEDINFDLINAGQQFFGLDQETLRSIQQKTNEILLRSLTDFGIEYSANKRLPLPEQAVVPNKTYTKSKLLSQAQGISRFNSALIASGNKEYQFGEVLRVLSEYFFDAGTALIFKADAETQTIAVSEGTNSTRVQASLTLKLSASPSLLAHCFQDAKALVFDAEHEDIKVADLQILSMLDKPAILCDPIIHKGKVRAMLVYGVNKAAGEDYLKATAMRNSLHQLFLEREGNGAKAAADNKQFYYQQKIREAVHEANNPLSIIKNYLQLLSLKQDEDSAIQEELKVIETEIERVKQILSKLGNNSETEDQDSALDLNKIITGINRVFSASISKSNAVSIELDLDPNLPFIKGKENSLKQLLINLLKNAVEACEKEGRVRIETRSNINLNQTNYVLINIIDNGPGIADGIMENLFQPGNTTKDDSHTGSGLAIVKNFMDELGGLISCQSDQHGTTFSLLLPKPEGSPLQSAVDRKNTTHTESESSPSKVYDFKR